MGSRSSSGGWQGSGIPRRPNERKNSQKRIDANLFKALLPYLLSITGNQVDRLLIRAAEIITQSIENDEDDEDEEEKGDGKKEKEGEDDKAGLSLKRAIKIKFEFSKLTKAPAK